MECKFVVGQKVVCVNASPNLEHGHSGLQEGAVYTISGFSDGYIGGDIGIHLFEVRSSGQRPFGLGEVGYGVTRFAPVHERKTDISVFTALLTPAGQKKRIRETEKA